jgi:hypothetical protein
MFSGIPWKLGLEGLQLAPPSALLNSSKFFPTRALPGMGWGNWKSRIEAEQSWLGSDCLHPELAGGLGSSEVTSPPSLAL